MVDAKFESTRIPDHPSRRGENLRTLKIATWLGWQLESKHGHKEHKCSECPLATVELNIE
jgi:hypothetical protein